MEWHEIGSTFITTSFFLSTSGCKVFETSIPFWIPFMVVRSETLSPSSGILEVTICLSHCVKSTFSGQD
jgi:hypothetical protein